MSEWTNEREATNIYFIVLYSYCMSVIVLSVPVLLLIGNFWRNPKDKDYAILKWNIIENSTKSTELWWRNLWGFLWEEPSIAHSLKISYSHIQHKPTKWRILCLQLNWRLSSKVPHSAVISKHNVRRGAYWRAQWWQSRAVLSVTPVPSQFYCVWLMMSFECFFFCICSERD